MNITVLVGNGFDIASGIDTSYSSFYKWYCAQPSAKPHIELFKRDIQNDVDNGGKNWADFEIGLGRYTAKFTPKTVNDFIECYEDAHSSIIEYLELEQQKLSDSIPEAEVKKLREGVAGFYQELSPVEQNQFNSIFQKDLANNTIIQLISFNYTTLIDKCAELLAKEPLKQWTYNLTKQMKVNRSVTHIHGTSKKFPILGVNDPSQVANQELLSVPQFSELLIKPQSVNAIGELWHAQAIRFIKESQIVCIFGMSLGDSDSLWWQQIMAWLRNESSRHLVIFWHTSTLQNMRLSYRYAREKAQVQNLFTGFSHLSADTIQLIKERIHVVFNTQKFLQISFERPKAGLLSGK